MNNQLSILPGDVVCLISSYLPLKDLFNFKETCKQLDNTISDFFKLSNLTQLSDPNTITIGRIFCPGKQVFSIKSSADDLKIFLASNQFFKYPCFDEFMKNWCQKFAEDLLPLCIKRSDEGKLNFSLPLTYQREEMAEAREKLLRISREFHPIFEEELFVLFEAYGFSSLLADLIVKKYLQTKEDHIEVFETAAMFPLECLISPHFVPIYENFYDLLFKGYIQKLIDSRQEENLEDLILEIEEDLRVLNFLNASLESISQGKYDNPHNNKIFTLTKPYISLSDRCRPEYLKALALELKAKKPAVVV